MTKAQFFATFPKTRKEFVSKWNADYVFRGNAQRLGFSVIGENVIFPNGKVANAKVR